MIGGDIRSVRERPTPLSVIVHALLIWVVAMVQVGFFNRLPLFGATIEVVLCGVAYVGWRRGALTGALTGVVGGFMLDALGEAGLSLSPLVFMVVGIYAAFVAERLFDHPLTYLLALSPVHLAVAVWRAVEVGSWVHALAVLAGAYLASIATYAPTILRKIKKRR